MQEKESTIKTTARRIRIFVDFLFAGIKVCFLKPYWHKKEIYGVMIMSLITNLLIWVYLFDKRIESDYPIVLHYNLFFGVDMVGDYRKIYFLPLVGLIIIILNSALGQFFYKIERLSSYIITLNTLIVQIILAISSYLIIRANS